MNQKLTIISLLFIFTFGYIIYEAKKLESKFGGVDTSTTGTIIKTLPQVKFLSYPDDKKEFDPRDLTKAGNHIVIHFWATWCGPCEQEFPELVEMMTLLKNKTNVKFLLVAVNDEKTKMKKFLSKFDLNLDNIVIVEDRTNAHKELGTYKMPETFIFDTKNEIVKKYTGQQPWTQKYIIDTIQAL